MAGRSDASRARAASTSGATPAAPAPHPPAERRQPRPRRIHQRRNPASVRASAMDRPWCFPKPMRDGTHSSAE